MSKRRLRNFFLRGWWAFPLAESFVVTRWDHSQVSLFLTLDKKRKNQRGLNAKLSDHIPEENFLPDSIIESFQRSAFTNGDVKDIQQNLLEMGIDFDSKRRKINLDGSNNTLIISPFDRVPGCVANVNVRTILIPMNITGDTQQKYRVLLDGDADAFLSKGLLAILSKVFGGLETTPLVTSDDILQIDSESVTDLLGLRNVLSKGRNDGVASMTRVAQGQIRALLNNDEVFPVPDTTINNNVKNVLQNHHKSRKTVAMLLSGGVDSSVALNLLKREGYDVTAFYLKIWLEDELAHLGNCPWEDDYRMCQQVCEQAGVPLESISLQAEYKHRVISYTVNEAQRGRTPNPDILCNSRIKFGCFYDAIEGRGFDYVASGHYAQLTVDKETGLQKLLRAPDPVKDQSYFLCALSQEQLRRVLFPIGHLQKSEVRSLAQEFDLPNKNRPDSQGLCFLGKVKFDEFLSAYLGHRPGNIIDARTGDILGKHNGVWYHTVGQRKGLGKVLDPKATSKGPWYVVAKKPKEDLVFASNEYDDETFESARSKFWVEDIKWINNTAPSHLFDKNGSVLEQKIRMKIRHGPKIVSGTLELADGEGSSGNVKLENKDGGLAPGQYVVFYTLDDLECLGGGVISEQHWANFLVKNSVQSSNSVTST